MDVDLLRQTFPSYEWPRFMGLETADNNAVIALYVDADLRWFTGHFPEQPVLAGVVQTHWAGELGRFLFSLADPFVRLDNLKFQSVLLPGQNVSLILDYLPDTHALKFRYEQEGLSFSEGKFVFDNG